MEAFERLKTLEILGAIHENLGWDAWLMERFKAARTFSIPAAWAISDPPDLRQLLYSLWLIRLDLKQIDAISKRLHFPGALKADILDAHRLCEFLCDLPIGLKVSEIVDRLEESRERSLIAAYLALQPDSEAQQALEAYLTQWRSLHPATNGDDLRGRGLPPGPHYREILWRLRAAWLDGEIQDLDGETRLLEHVLRERDRHA